MTMQYWVLKDQYKILVDAKTDAAERYAEEQADMKEAFEAGRRYHFHKVYKKVCPSCGDVFYTTTHDQKYDSIVCKNKARRENRRELLSVRCHQCGEHFIPKRTGTLYCSNKCRQAAYRYRKKNDTIVEPLPVTQST